MPQRKKFDEDEVLDRAMRAFWNRGYEATSIQDLVNCTGINRGSLYGTFGDKHELFLTTLTRYDGKIRRDFLKSLEHRYAPREAIRRFFLGFIDNISEQGENPGCFLTNTALELAAHDEQARRIVARAQEQIEDFFFRMIRKDQRAGGIPDNLNARVTARSLLATLQGVIVLTRSRPKKALLRSIVDDAMKRLA